MKSQNILCEPVSYIENGKKKVTAKFWCLRCFNPLNAELNPTRHLLALVGARHIVHVSRIRVKLWRRHTWRPILWDVAPCNLVINNEIPQKHLACHSAASQKITHFIPGYIWQLWLTLWRLTTYIYVVPHS